MEKLKHILEEDGGVFATPGNVSGMGNPTMPGTGGEIGSGDAVTVPIGKTKQKKSKKYKKYTKLRNRIRKKLFDPELD